MGEKSKKKKTNNTLDGALKALNDALGENTVYVYGKAKRVQKERLSTGSISLDYITGGGWVVGTLNKVSGWESTGKSTVCLHSIKACQDSGGTALYVDHEHVFDKAYAEALGIDVDALILTQPDCIEDGYTIINDLVSTGEIDLVIFDSIAAAQTRADLEGEVEKRTIGIKATINSKMFPRFASLFRKTKTTGIWVNQFREKVGVMYGSPITEPGGNSPKYFVSINLKLSRSTQITDGEEVTGNIFKAECTKNKTAAPYKSVEYIIEYGKGIVKDREVFDFGVQMGIINKSGSWYSMGDTKLGQGSEKALVALTEHDKLKEVEQLIRDTLAL